MSTTITSAIDPAFLAQLRSWLEEGGELLVLFRYSAAAGSREFELFDSYPDLETRVRGLAASTSVIAFKQGQLPLRGVADDDFIAVCLAAIPDGSEYLVLQTQRVTYGSASWYHHDDGNSHEQLRAELEDLRGLPVAVGLHPPWLVDSAEVISAIMPGEDGIPRVGVY